MNKFLFYISGVMLGIGLTLFTVDYFKLKNMCYKDHANLKTTYSNVWGKNNYSTLHDSPLYLQIWKLEDRVEELETK